MKRNDIPEYKFRFTEENEGMDDELDTLEDDESTSVAMSIEDLIEELSDIVSKEDLGKILSKVGEFLTKSGDSISTSSDEAEEDYDFDDELDGEASEEDSDDEESEESEESEEDKEKKESVNIRRNQRKIRMHEAALEAAIGTNNIVNWQSVFSELKDMVSLPAKNLETALKGFLGKIHDLPADIKGLFKKLMSTDDSKARLKFINETPIPTSKGKNPDSFA
jgi:Skp family chaperone for outer membrane proteins